MGQTPGFEFVNHPVGREEQQLRMGVGHKQCGHHVFVFGGHALQALAAAPLAAEVGQDCAFDIPTCGDCNDHVFLFDQVFVFHIPGPIGDFGAAGHCKLVPNFAQFIRNDAHDPVARP